MTDLDVAVVGGGISGLATAHWVSRQGRSVSVFEAADRVGGRMATRRHDGYLIDEGAETLAVHGYPATWRLLDELGVGGEEILPVRSSVGMWRKGRAHPRVGHPLGGVTGAGLTLRGRMEMSRMTSRLLRRAGSYDVDHPESTPLGTTTVAEFAADYSAEMFQYLLQPAVGTAFGWQPERSCMGPFVASMVSTRGIWKWRTYRDGMDTLARRAAATLDVRTSRPVAEVTAVPGGARLVFEDGAVLTARQVVLAVPAPLAARMHPGAPADEREYLRACGYAPMARVTCLLDRPLEPARRGLAPPVYALLLPEVEDQVLGGLTIEHNKAANRAPSGAGLVSLLPAAGTAGELLTASDETVAKTLLDRAEAYLPGVRAACTSWFVHRFPCGAVEASPQALRARPEFARRPTRTVEYAGDWLYLRASSEGAVRSAQWAAERVSSHAPGGVSTARAATSTDQP
ncbi:hypothetical protein AQ490_04620 [Wenjunlia vitaminophila]|uniref:Amine oxidase domain-containing protein n=1 Tax=Wenjunlia vitaminophila TaxID=76728 RepID=A0A0T6LNI1_WENVI|nr:NAD(P)/FAD-dependent oxidoreductase [Wenjunlia vitaminophila]KRV47677.1 hypothetical protein AQ490_04620 [Wenjunlia vitaminophila]